MTGKRLTPVVMFSHLLTVPSYALGGAPYTIHFFLGDVTDPEVSSSTTSLFDHPRHVGSVYTFSRVYTDGETVRCPNCAHQADYEALSTGQVPLTITLVKHAEDQSNHDINHIDHRSVDRYLTRHLTWKVLSVSFLSKKCYRALGGLIRRSKAET